MLATQDYDGPEDATPLLIAHGLFGQGRNWASLAKLWSERRRVTTVDMRNHGDSFHSDTHGYDDLAADLAAVADGHDVLGHSMGGKAAMMLALTQPDRVRRLVVVDIAPVAYDHTKADLVEAMQALDLAPLETRRDADTALAATVDSPMVRAFLLQSLDVRDKRWSLNLDTLGREMETLTGWPAPDAQWDGPALFIAGATSDYVTAEGEDAIAHHFLNARVERVAGAGHWVHAEQPDAVRGLVDDFLAD